MTVEAPTEVAPSGSRARSAVWWMAVLFAIGSACFVVASIPGVVQLVGSALDAGIYFVGSIFFTSAATIQWLTSRGLAFDVLDLDWWSSSVQLIGTLYFNATTFRAFQTGLDANEYDRLVWTPDALGSVCFLVASYFACVAVSGPTARPRWTRDSDGTTCTVLHDRSSRLFGIASRCPSLSVWSSARAAGVTTR